MSEAYREQVGLPILQAWGMTETSPVATTGRIKSTLLDRSDAEGQHPPHDTRALGRCEPSHEGALHS